MFLEGVRQQYSGYVCAQQNVDTDAGYSPPHVLS